MNKLKTDILGGFPWVLDDFRWHHDQTRDVLNAVVQGLNLSNGDARLFGVEITGSGATRDITAGYLLVDGEVIRVDAHTVPALVGGNYYHVVTATTFDPAGNKSLEDGGTADAYEKRRATLAVGTLPSGDDKVYTAATFPTLPETIASQTLDLWSGEWNLQTAAEITGLSPNIDSFESDSYIAYKKIGRFCYVVIKFRVNLNTPSESFSVNVPSPIIPQDSQDICCTRALIGASSSVCTVRVSVIPIPLTRRIAISPLVGTFTDAEVIRVEASFAFPCVL